MKVIGLVMIIMELDVVEDVLEGITKSKWYS